MIARPSTNGSQFASWEAGGSQRDWVPVARLASTRPAAVLPAPRQLPCRELALHGHSDRAHPSARMSGSGRDGRRIDSGRQLLETLHGGYYDPCAACTIPRGAPHVLAYEQLRVVAADASGSPVEGCCVSHNDDHPPCCTRDSEQPCDPSTGESNSNYEKRNCHNRSNDDGTDNVSSLLQVSDPKGKPRSRQ